MVHTPFGSIPSKGGKCKWNDWESMSPGKQRGEGQKASTWPLVATATATPNGPSFEAHQFIFGGTSAPAWVQRNHRLQSSGRRSFAKRNLQSVVYY